MACKPSEEDKKNQRNTLMYLLGDKVDDILASFQPNNEQSLNSDIVKIRFDKYFTVKKSVIYERAVFNKRVQMSNKPIYWFILSLYCLLEHFRFGALKG